MRPLDPGTAPPRPDLTFLRHRARPAKPASPPPPPPPVPTRQRPPDRAPSPAPLDLGPPPAPPPAPAPNAGSPLDLTPPAPSAGSGSSLDLFPTGPPVGAPPAPTAPAGRHRVPFARDARRTAGSSATRLTTAEPTVTLTRIQSGTGALELTLVRPASAGDLSLGCVFQLADGTEGVVQQLGGVTAGPAGSVLPVARWKARPDGETITFDLRQVNALRRALVYGYSPSIAVLAWSGVLVVTTYGGARIETPIAHAPFSGTLALLTILNVGGELVLRVEMDPYHGPPEMAAVAFDHHVPWLDGRTPLA
jgi:uncharacterized protein involved in tellurium resistance